MPRSGQAAMDLFLRRLGRRSVLTEEEQAAIRALPGHSITVKANRDIVKMGQSVKHACLIVDGLALRFAETSGGVRQGIEIHIPGDMADLHSVVAPDVVLPLQALSTTVVWQIPHEAVLKVATDYPAISHAFWRDGIVDAGIIGQSVLNLGQRKALARVAHLYCELSMRYDQIGENKNFSFPFAATQEQLSGILGLTPVHVNRTLRKLRDLGLLQIGRKETKVLDWKGLEELAEFNPFYLHLARVDLHVPP